MAIQLTKLTQSNLIDTVFNDIKFKLGYYNTSQPSKKDDTLYVEIYTIPNKNLLLTGAGKTGSTFLTRLIVDTDTTGNATFYLNDALSTAFTTQQLPSNELLQRDTNNYVGYYLKYGYVNYALNNSMGYKKIGETDIRYVLRGVLQENEYLSVVDYVYGVDYLTHLPNNIEIHKNENTYLPFLLPKVADTGKGILVKGDFYYADNTHDIDRTVASYLINQGGLYLLNSNPALLVDDTTLLTDFSIWIEYDTVDGSAEVLDTPQDVYTANATYTANCPSGFYGASVTSAVTAYSNVSQVDAQTQATIQAKENAEASLTCNILYTSTQSYTAKCGTGTYGEYTATSTVTSYTSQVDADAQAYTQAMSTAQASLQCTVIINTYTSTKSYTATCAAGLYGAAVTRTATAISYTSQSDADSKSLAQATTDATAALQCSAQPQYTSTQSYTAHCPDGYKGPRVTKTATATSSISQDDADVEALRLAQDYAEGSLQCIQNF
jgi:hypothetical protein